MGAAFSYTKDAAKYNAIDRDSFVCAKVHNKVY
jgi:hypothetical protein